MKMQPNRAKQRAARKRAETAMAAIARDSFNRAFSEMLQVSVREGAPCDTHDLKRWFVRAMENRLRWHMARA